MKYNATKHENIYSYETKSGATRYRVRVYYTNPSGKRSEHSKSGFKNIAEAKAYRSTVESKFATGQVNIVAGQNRTLEHQWNDYKQSKISGNLWNLSTLETMESRIDHWLEKFGNVAMTKISRTDVQNYIAELYQENDYSQETMKGIFKAFMQVIDDAVAEDYLAKNYFTKVSYVKDKDWQPKPKVVALDTYKKFMQTAAEHMRADMYRCLYLSTFGLRRGEVYGIKSNSISFLDNGYAKIDITCSRTAKYPEGKSVKSRDSNRMIVVDQVATKMLREQIAFAKIIKANLRQILNVDDFIFITPETGEPYYISALNDHMDRICRMIDDDLSITPHMLRHMFASYASASGIDSLQLRKYLGHADESMTDHYTHGTVEGATQVMLLTQDYRSATLRQLDKQ